MPKTINEADDSVIVGQCCDISSGRGQTVVRRGFDSRRS